MPKSAANFTSGGAASIFTASGNRRALASGRPLSSATPSGSSTRPALSASSGAANFTSVTVAEVCLSKAGAIALPPISSRIAFARSSGIGAVKRTYAGSTGLHPACGLTREHSNRASKLLRTV